MLVKIAHVWELHNLHFSALHTTARGDYEAAGVPSVFHHTASFGRNVSDVKIVTVDERIGASSRTPC
jgi:hypothetical protein